MTQRPSAERLEEIRELCLRYPRGFFQEKELLAELDATRAELEQARLLEVDRQNWIKERDLLASLLKEALGALERHKPSKEYRGSHNQTCPERAPEETLSTGCKCWQVLTLTSIHQRLSEWKIEL